MTIKKNSKSPLASKIDDESLSNQAYEKIEELIVTMSLEPGSPVSEAKLSTMLNIGRTPIREAMQRLSREHLVSIMPKRGIFIADLNPQKQLRVLETRRELERLICKKAAKRATPDERKEFERIAKDFRRAQKERNEKLFLKVDKELNDLTVIAAKNEYAGAAMASLHGMSRRFWFGNFQHSMREAPAHDHERHFALAKHPVLERLEHHIFLSNKLLKDVFMRRPRVRVQAVGMPGPT